MGRGVVFDRIGRAFDASRSGVMQLSKGECHAYGSIAGIARFGIRV